MMRSRLGGACVAAIGLFVTHPAWAYRVLEKDGVPVGWDSSTVVFDIEQNVPDGVDFDLVFEQVQLAAKLWNSEATCQASRIHLTAVRAGAGASGDGRNTIQWVHSNWAGTGQPDKATGFTDILVETTNSGSRIVETDIWLNGERFDWTSAATEPPSLINISGTVAHEFGHALGLDHPCTFEESNSIPVCSEDGADETLMYPTVLTSAPKLTDDDVAGLCAIYTETDCAASDDGCSSGSTDTPPETVDECSNDSDCGADEYCYFGTCMKVPGVVGDVCDKDADCGSYLCVKGACREACDAAFECLSGQECNKDTRACGTGTLAFGVSCKSAEKCVTGLCYIDPGPESYCTRQCNDAASCPDGYACDGRSDDGTSFCVIPVEKSSGCTVTGRSSRGGLWGLLVLGLLVVGRKLRTVRTGK